MAIEIEQLLARLTGVNDKMAEYTHSAGVPSLNAALMHTLQRHRDILQDYTHEFHKTKANFMAIRERENLMGSVRKDIESYKSGSGVNNRRTELFLKEHDHLRNSDRLIEETISIAMATKENMTSQRGMLKSIHSKMNTLANRFPAVNSLIQRINLRKRRDSLILGGVIGICTILLLLYAFHWEVGPRTLPTASAACFGMGNLQRRETVRPWACQQMNSKLHRGSDLVGLSWSHSFSVLSFLIHITLFLILKTTKGFSCCISLGGKQAEAENLGFSDWWSQMTSGPHSWTPHSTRLYIQRWPHFQPRDWMWIKIILVLLFNTCDEKSAVLCWYSVIHTLFCVPNSWQSRKIPFPTDSVRCW